MQLNTTSSALNTSAGRGAPTYAAAVTSSLAASHLRPGCQGTLRYRLLFGLDSCGLWCGLAAARRRTDGKRQGLKTYRSFWKQLPSTHIKAGRILSNTTNAGGRNTASILSKATNRTTTKARSRLMMLIPIRQLPGWQMIKRPSATQPYHATETCDLAGKAVDWNKEHTQATTICAWSLGRKLLVPPSFK